MPLTPRTRLGPYEILAPIGAGGMGEVYRAKDTNLNRDVALKILPESFALDADRVARFKREAQVLASLNHPNIAAIYGIEASGVQGPTSNVALVMELVEGEDLSAHIARGALPLSDALPIARQIADALEAAHEQGIIHRDLKPANIKLREDGAVKVLDFGLAKALDSARAGATDPASAEAMNSPTMTARATAMGMILGTAAYMSPEQAKGRAVDKRADIWAFGAVLYEMLSGKRAFAGEDITDTLTSVMRDTPAWTALPANTPPRLRRLIERCLERDLKMRLRDIGEARVAIDEIIAGKGETGTTPTPTKPSAAWTRVLPWALVGVMAIAAGVLYLRAPIAEVGRPLHSEIVLPADVEFFSGPSLSADGRRLAFVGVRLGVRQVYTRSLDETELRAIPGTEGAATVALSPDGSAAAFIGNDTRLRRVNFATAIVEPLAEGAWIYSAPSWMSDGSIVFSRGRSLVLRLRDGGERELATLNEAADEYLIAWPVVAAGDGTVLFVSRRKTAAGIRSRIEAMPAAGGPRRVVLDGADQVVFASADRVLFQKDGALFVAPFAADRDATVGTPVRLGESTLSGQIGGVAAAVSASGALVVAPPTVLDSHLVWISMDGSERPIPGPVRGFLNPRVSPDGRRIAFSEAGSIWMLDPERTTFTRITSSNESTVGFPLWSRDGKHIFYRSTEGIRVQSAEGEGASSLLPNTAVNDYPTSVTPDGTTIVLVRLAADTGGDLYATPAAGGPLTPLLVTRTFEGGAQISPDGKWLIYVSNESGRMEVMLRPFKGADRKWSVSSEGGIHAIWSRDGKRIYFRNGQQLLEVDVTTTPDVRLSVPKVLFVKRFAFGQNISIPNYSLGADGREFLVVEEAPGGRHLNLILNWLQSAGR